jgi:hypothetical protein
MTRASSRATPPSTARRSHSRSRFAATPTASRSRRAPTAAAIAKLIPAILAYYAGRNTIHIRAGTCADAIAFLHGICTAETVGAFTTLLHESRHRQGFKNENLTEAFAIAAMHTAGRFVQYEINMHNGATDQAAAWRAAAPYGDKVMHIAFEQSNRVVAASYHTSWREVLAARQFGWAAWLKR